MLMGGGGGILLLLGGLCSIRISDPDNCVSVFTAFAGPTGAPGSTAGAAGVPYSSVIEPVGFWLDFLGSMGCDAT